MHVFSFITPDEAIMRIMLVPLILSAIGLLIAIPLALHRRNMALNDPEKYRRLRAWEEEERKRQKKAMAETARAGLKAARVGIRAARFILKK